MCPLGTTIFSEISIKNIDNAVNDIHVYMRTNNLMADFLYAESTTLSLLYNLYCMNVYGSQLWSVNNKSVERFMWLGEKQLEKFGD